MNLSKRPLQHERRIQDVKKYYRRDNVTNELTLTSKKQRSELDILKENYKFLSDDEDNIEKQEINSIDIKDLENKKEDQSTLEWERKVVENYQKKLIKEYCIADLRFYKEGKVALRWRSEGEVLSGIGETKCGNLYCKTERKLLKEASQTNYEIKTLKSNLSIWEVDFVYIEGGQRKEALVKLVLCKKCSKKLKIAKPDGRRID